MKNKIILIVILVFGMAAVNSCAAFPPDLTSSGSWSVPAETKGTVRIDIISADKANGWASVEKEIEDILPLIFLQNNYALARSSDAADILCEVKVREREYSRLWRLERSLSAEVYLRSALLGPSPDLLSAGRVIRQGNSSLSSSKILSRMLEKAVKDAIKAMVKT